MKPLLLLTSILITLVLTGVIQGSYSNQRSVESLSLSEAYMNQYPVTMPNLTFLSIKMGLFNVGI
jgi:hypothetical protein